MDRQRSTGAFAMLGGGALVVVGSLLPWATVDVVILGSIDIAGTKGDGVITVVLGIGIAVAGLLCLRRGADRGPATLLGIIAAVVAAAMAGYELLNIERIASHADVISPLVHASAGVGLYLVVAGGILALVGSLMKRNEGTPGPSPPSGGDAGPPPG